MNDLPGWPNWLLIAITLSFVFVLILVRMVLDHHRKLSLIKAGLYKEHKLQRHRWWKSSGEILSGAVTTVGVGLAIYWAVVRDLGFWGMVGLVVIAAGLGQLARYIGGGRF